jgi:hypothetical protein
MPHHRYSDYMRLFAYLFIEPRPSKDPLERLLYLKANLAPTVLLA